MRTRRIIFPSQGLLTHLMNIASYVKGEYVMQYIAKLITRQCQEFLIKFFVHHFLKRPALTK